MMTDREKVIRCLKACLLDDCDSCPYYDEEVPDSDYHGKCYRMRMYADALNLIERRENDYEAWAKDIGAHTCATCYRRDCDCPIENTYALPLERRNGLAERLDGVRIDK